MAFSAAEFHDSNVNFYRTQFLGENNVNFNNVIFGEGIVNFNEAQFGKRDSDFSNARFGDGRASFVGTQFGGGTIDFSGAKFGKGYVSFRDARFGKGTVNFDRADFGDSNVDFTHAHFDDGDTSFFDARFGDGSLRFDYAWFGIGEITFRQTRWKGSCIFSPRWVNECTKIDFSSVSVDGELSFGKFKTSCVIDLRHAKLNRPIDLDRTEINYGLEPEKWKGWPFHRAANSIDSTCFRRLKKLAKEADDHERALDFYAKEMRSSYGHSLTGWKLALFFAYDKISDYGRSLLYPFLCLVLCTEVFGIIYWWKGTEATRSINDGFTFSLGHAVPLYAGSREARTGNANALFGSIDKIPDYIHALTVGQGLICGVFLFLIALALRNHFRS